VDVGGTSVKIGIISAKGDIYKKWEIKTDKSNGGQRIMEDVWNSVQQKLSESNISSDNIYAWKCHANLIRY
ncbi:hypothetical protein R0K17_29290, partial [Planococcus sp. SIMBA_143]